MSDQENGMKLFDDAMSQIVLAKVQPSLNQIDENIKQTKKEFSEIETNVSSALASAVKAKNEAESVVNNTIGSHLEPMQKEIRDNSELALQNGDAVSNLAKEISEVKKKILGESVAGEVKTVSSQEIDNAFVMKMQVPSNVDSLTYVIDKQKKVAKIQNGKFVGDHIVDSSVENDLHTIKLNRKLDEGTSFSFKLSERSHSELIAELTNTVKEQAKQIAALQDVNKKFFDFFKGLQEQE